jgi:hypothetical protein
LTLFAEALCIILTRHAASGWSLATLPPSPIDARVFAVVTTVDSTPAPSSALQGVLLAAQRAEGGGMALVVTEDFVVSDSTSHSTRWTFPCAAVSATAPLLPALFAHVAAWCVAALLA